VKAEVVNAWRSPVVVIAAGVCAALHVGKLPPAISALQQSLGVSLVQAGFLLSLVQFAGMTAGIAFGAWADSMGLKRSITVGLSILALASAAGGLVQTSAWLLVLRAVEGFGLLLVVLPAPALLRRLVPAAHVNQLLGVWGAYMPFGAALALLAGPAWIDALGWRSWWWGIGAASALMAIAVARAVPALHDSAGSKGAPYSWPARLRTTLSRTGPWLVALTFAVYSGQWLAVIGFLPTIYRQDGMSAGSIGVLTALAAAANVIGNIAAGRLLQGGAKPAVLMSIGFATMAVGSAAVFAGSEGAGLPTALRYLAVLGFSALGGLIPGALFATAVRVAPDERTISTTVGWMQQWSSFGQFAGPPLVAWVATRAGGWQWTWIATGLMCLAGLVLAKKVGQVGNER